MQFTFAFLIKHIYLYFKFLVLKLFHANVLRDYLFIVHNVLKLCILANHYVTHSDYLQRAYLISNFRTKDLHLHGDNFCSLQNWSYTHGVPQYHHRISPSIYASLI